MPNTSKPIKVNLSGTGTIGGQYARVVNRTTGEVHPTATRFSTDRNLIFDCADFDQGWTAADVLEVSTVGGAYGVALITLNSTNKNQTVTLTATTESATLPRGGN